MVFLVFTAWLILSQVMISLVQAFFASAGYGFLAGITYAAQPVYGTPRPFFPISPDCTEYIGTNDG